MAAVMNELRPLPAIGLPMLEVAVRALTGLARSFVSVGQAI